MIEIHEDKVVAELFLKNRFPACFCLFLKNRLLELRQALSEGGEDPATLSLKEFGYPVILEPSDNLRNLEGAGMAEGLFACIPEAVERLIFDGLRVYCVSVAFNNSFMLEFLLPDDSDARKYPELPGFLKKWDCRDVFKTGKARFKKAA